MYNDGPVSIEDGVRSDGEGLLLLADGVYIRLDKVELAFGKGVKKRHVHGRRSEVGREVLIAKGGHEHLMFGIRVEYEDV